MNVALPRLQNNLDATRNLVRLIKQDVTLNSVTIQCEDISHIKASSFTGSELKLEKITATEARLEKAGFTDVELLDCSLVATVFSGSSWRRVLFKNSRCSGIQLQTSTLRDVTFINCKLDLANFRFAKLTNVHFKECAIIDTDFYSAELNNVTFEKCDLDKAEFSGSKLKKVDLRSSDITNISGITSLAGSIIDPVQLIGLAPRLASELKITVKDD
jgi:uncharacterized protein YjbI with pentapeptide repeats